eukprot:scaffold8110_cov267-Pinguiococcus_pyrenoidosus.AAC.6
MRSRAEVAQSSGAAGDERQRGELSGLKEPTWGRQRSACLSDRRNIAKAPEMGRLRRGRPTLGV